MNHNNNQKPGISTGHVSGPACGSISDAVVEAACVVMHDAYEAAAIEAGWETQARSRVAWVDVPEANKATMRAAVMALIPHLTREADEAIVQADNLAGDVAVLERERDEARAEVDMAMRMHQVQFDRANRLEAERNLARAESERLSRTVADLERIVRANTRAHAAGRAEGVAAVKTAVEGVFSELRNEYGEINYEEDNPAAAIAEAAWRVSTALASVDGGETE